MEHPIICTDEEDFGSRRVGGLECCIRRVLEGKARWGYQHRRRVPDVAELRGEVRAASMSVLVQRIGPADESDEIGEDRRVGDPGGGAPHGAGGDVGVVRLEIIERPGAACDIGIDVAAGWITAARGVGGASRHAVEQCARIPGQARERG